MRERILKFQAVGAVGIAVQMTALAFFHGCLGWGVMAATAMAVEMAILHNFVWHVRWTWAQRHSSSLLQLLWRYNLTYCLISITTNVAATCVLISTFHLHYLVANLLAICAGGAANFLAGEFLIFR